MHEWLNHAFQHLSAWYMIMLQSWGYPAIVLMMALESSVFPLPSEIVIPPAAHLVATGQLQMSLTGITIAGTLGSWIGATCMYWCARLAGRPLIMRYGKYVMIPPQKVELAERWANHHGAFGIFFSRLLPVVRHLIGLPAGMIRMSFKTFSIFTVIGSALWSVVLCWVGVKAGQDAQLMNGDMHRIAFWAIGAALILGSVYYFFVHRSSRKE
jgi:membrane protein DedA with SNARE-associated domain